MVLVDTSVWIRFLAYQEPWRRELDHLLAQEQVAAHDLVYGEILSGDRGGRRKFLSAYELMRRAETISHQEVVHFARSRDLHGRGAGWIDTHLLASALAEGMNVWTADAHLHALAVELGIAHKRGA
ncbi:MAG: PIN domain-containing protein [Acidobacteriota bacterium]